jgi:endogenous inhibitor of DNA gyrase (YacG/DUF329 family)
MGSLTVKCPSCGANAQYGPDNPWRPFCSERCRNHDLGAWASERFRIASPPAGVEPPDEIADRLAPRDH